MYQVKKIIGYEKYFIDTKGNIFSKQKRTISKLIPKKTRYGYYSVNLYNDNGRKTFFVHRLVAMMFIENKESKPCVDHINGNRIDNDITNLRWCTNKENSNFSLAKKNLSNALKGKTVTFEKRKKISETLKNKYKSGEIIPSMLGKHHTENTKMKLRERKKRSDEELLSLWFYRYDNNLTEQQFQYEVGLSWETVRFTIKHRKLSFAAI